MCSNAPDSAPAPCSITLTSLTLEDSELLVEPLHSHKVKLVNNLCQPVSSLVEHLPQVKIVDDLHWHDPSHELAVDRSAFTGTQVFLFFLACPLSHSLADSVDSQQNITMSSALNKMVPVFTGSNWQQLHTAMQAYLWAQGQWFIYTTTQPTDGHNDHKEWDENTEKVLSNITLHLAPSIQVAVSELVTIKEVWDYLKKNFSAPSISSAYTELSKLLQRLSLLALTPLWQSPKCLATLPTSRMLASNSLPLCRQ